MTRLACSLLLVLLTPVVGAAQQRSTGSRPPRFEVSAGVLALGPLDFGEATAALTGNETSSPDVTFFRAETQLGRGTGLDGRVGFNITRSLAVEAGFVWSRATVESRITSDVEGVPDITLAQDLDSYFIEASGVYHLNGAAFAGGKGVPFVSGGAGYLRQLDEEDLLIDTGRVYHVGGGVKVFFRQKPRGFIRGLGVRADARAYFRSGGFELEEETDYRTTWATGAGLVMRF